MPRKAIPWRFVALLGASAAFVAIPSVYAFWVTEATALLIEPFAWVALYAVLFIPLLVRARPGRPILTGLAAGIASGITTILVQSVLSRQYWDAHPEAATTFAGASTLTTSLAFAGTALGFGVVFGLLIGLVVWGFLRRARGKNENVDALNSS